MKNKPPHWRKLGRRPSEYCLSCPPRALCQKLKHQIKGTAPKCVEHPHCPGWKSSAQVEDVEPPLFRGAS